ncbi:MAG: hypothetical protein IH835_02530 [Proteobacteria bacterium]|nr:hypothetical protein [Pseudomonadota bacterium]
MGLEPNLVTRRDGIAIELPDQIVQIGEGSRYQLGVQHSGRRILGGQDELRPLANLKHSGSCGLDGSHVHF